jgi:hypothetical protein
MALYKRGDVYWLNLTIDGRRYQLSTDRNTKEAAEDWAAGWRRNKVLGEVGMAKKKRQTVDQLLDKVERHWKLEDPPRDSVQNMSLLKKVRAEWGIIIRWRMK